MTAPPHKVVRPAGLPENIPQMTPGHRVTLGTKLSDTVSAALSEKTAYLRWDQPGLEARRLLHAGFQHPPQRESQGTGDTVSWTQRDAPLGVTHLPCVFRPRLQRHGTWEVRSDLLRGRTDLSHSPLTSLCLPPQAPIHTFTRPGDPEDRPCPSHQTREFRGQPMFPPSDHAKPRPMFRPEAPSVKPRISVFFFI